MIEDKELVDLFKQEASKEKAYEMIIKKYQEKMYWHIRKMVVSHDDTDDVLQNVFLNVWLYLDNFRGDSSLYTWIYQIATNESLRFLNKKNKMKTYNFEDKAAVIENTLKQDPGFDTEKLEWKLQMAIQQLPDKQRLVFNMKYYDDMTYDDMSKILNTSVGALKASYFHATSKIEEYIKKEMEL